MKFLRLLVLCALLLALTACNEDPPSQRIPDTGGTVDAAVDTGGEADTASDTGRPDTGPMVECTSGGDCDSGVCMEGSCVAASCEDGVTNQDESDVDCGGDTCEACGDEKACGEAADCQSGVCEQGVCAVADCEDGVENGSETDVDCGGADSGCAGCANQKACEGSGDCQSGVCDDSGESPICVEATCMDGVKNARETDVDCGGPDCGACQAEEACSAREDCVSGVCENGKCQAPTCEDGVTNGAETGTDCGGKDCAACGAGEGCSAAEDCTSGVCDEMSNTCQAAACDDGIKNGTETGQDCGGMCLGCQPGASCNLKGDCQSGVCKGGACAAPTCSDGVKNGQETDVDCGGPSCGSCPTGQSCSADGDCSSNICQMGTCAAPSCTDGVKNAAESDVDCGGPQCGGCQTGKSCDDGGDCVSRVCSGGSCAAPSCNDKTKNGAETDVDCGGSMCTGCAPGGVCKVDGDCKSGVCTGGSCQKPTCSDGVTNGTETDTDCGGSCGSCTAGDACKSDGDCNSGVCTNGVCQAPDCSDKTQNGSETDVDCGGPSCNACTLGSSCQTDADCQSRDCDGGKCVACMDGDRRKVGSCGYKKRGTAYETCKSGAWSRKTTCEGVWYESCQVYAKAKPNASSGTVTVDPDGSNGPTAPMTAYCDMSSGGGGWTLLANFRSDKEMHIFDPAKRQLQDDSGGTNVSKAPQIWKSGVYGHVGFASFPVQGRELKMDCRTGPNASWKSLTRKGLFGDWSDGDKGKYGDGNGWGVFRWKTGRSNHFICGYKVGPPSQQYGGIALCKGPGSSGSWSNHQVSVSFDAPPTQYGKKTAIGCFGKGINRGASGKWEVRVWVR